MTHIAYSELVDTITHGYFTNDEYEDVIFYNGWLELGISRDVTKVVSLESFHEDFRWLCEHYKETCGY